MRSAPITRLPIPVLTTIPPLTLGLALAAGACDEDDYWQAQAASDARELALLAEVEVVEKSRAEFSADAAASAGTIDEEVLIEYADTYGRLGYFDTDLDLRPIIAGSSSDWVGATYSPTRKRVTLVQDSSGEVHDDVIVHEFVHALQDQHFDLVAYDDHATSDAFLARRAVVEGDAVLAQYRFIAEVEEGLDLDAIDWPALFGAWRDLGHGYLADSEYPPVFLDYVSFVYTYGFEYCAANLTGVSLDQPDDYRALPHDWELENELFTTRPPGTTQQILRRDLTGEGAPVEVGFEAVPPSLAASFDIIDWDSLGEWYVYLLLYPMALDPVELGLDPDVASPARELASRWRGDKVLFARDVATGDAVAVWTSAWEDEDSAQVMAQVMWQLHDATPPADGFDSVAGDGEPIRVETRGSVMVVAKNTSSEHAAMFADLAFAAEGSSAPRKRPSLARFIEALRRVQHRHPVIPRARPFGF